MRGITRRGRGRWRWILVIILAAGLLFGGDAAFRPVLEALAWQQAEQIAAETTATALLRLQETQPELFESLTVFEAYGGVHSLRVDTAAVNRLKSAAVLAVSEAFEREAILESGIPLGSLTCIQFLSGIGPDVPVRFRVTGAVICDFRSEFTSGGLNQTLYRLILDTRLEMTILLPLRTFPVSCSTSVLAAEAVLVGAVPFGA